MEECTYGFIPSTIPQIEYETSQELDSAVLDIYRSTQAANIFCDVIAEDDAAHGRFARSRLAHEKDFLLLGFLNIVHVGNSKASIKSAFTSLRLMSGG